MKLSDYALNSLVDFVIGEEGKSVSKKGSDLVKLFNRYGHRDIYDFTNGGLPKIDGSDRNPSRKVYAFDRLKKSNNSSNLSGILVDVVNETGVSDKETTANEINKIILPEGYKFEKIGEKFELIGAEDDEEIVNVEVTFEEIQAEILAELDHAKFLVWVAVAWFTNDVLYRKLVELKQRGVNVQVIIVDDDNNRKYGCPIESNFESKRIPLGGYFGNNKMHNKFCVIDLKTVINGSYNWSKAAEYNDENITVIRSRKMAESFAQKFIELKLR